MIIAWIFRYSFPIDLLRLSQMRSQLQDYKRGGAEIMVEKNKQVSGWDYS